MGKIALGHLQHISRVGHKDVASLFVGTDKLSLASLEVVEFFGIIALYPAGFVKADGLPATLRSVLMQQAVLYNLKLQLPHGSYNLAPVETIDKQLCNAFVHQLVYTFLQLFGFHRVGILDIFEQLGREAGQAFEVQLFALGEGIAYLEITGIGQAHNIAGEGLVDHRLFLCHKGRRTAEPHHLAAAYVLIVGIALEMPRADLHKCDAAAVIGVHIGVYLEDETREFLF